MEYEHMLRYISNAILLSISCNFSIFVFSALYPAKKLKPFSLTWRYFILYLILFAIDSLFTVILSHALGIFKIIYICMLTLLGVFALKYFIRDIRKKESANNSLAEQTLFFVLFPIAAFANPHPALAFMIFSMDGIALFFYIEIACYLITSFLFALLGFILGNCFPKKFNFIREVAIVLICIAKILWL